MAWTYIINDLSNEEADGTFFEKESQKSNQIEFKVKEVIKRKGAKLYVIWNGHKYFFNNWIDKKDVVYRLYKNE